ncbi:hypothetical protein SDC9_80532 [bioreactor metagenome]|uniref:DUF4834 domain-containing protein n=1 Tax=bioreactor metagenome TaxID=1076179 RepID=A0A644Z1Q4_9ZZZZ
MGYLFKVLLVFAVIYMVINFLGRALFGTRRKPQANPYNRQSQQPQNEPETQEDRILDYQKKSFETTDAIDVEFEEIKQKERR